VEKDGTALAQGRSLPLPRGRLYPPTASAPDSGAGLTRRPRDPLSHACLPPAASFPPFAFRLASTHLGWGTRRQFTRRSRGSPGFETPTMVLTEIVSEFFPGNGVGVGMGGEVGLPPRLGCSSQWTGTIQNFLPVVTLSGMQFPLHSTQPVFSIHGVKRVSERWGMTSHEFSTLVPRHLRHLRLRWWLLLLLLLNGGQSLTDGLNCLSLHQKHLLDGHRGRGGSFCCWGASSCGAACSC
jgi:hypothetical protein